jgi:hypothetical protein
VGFLRETSSSKADFERQFYAETQHLKDEAIKFLWQQSLKDWVEGRTIELLAHKKDRRGETENILTPGVGELQREVEQLEKSSEELRVPTGMGEFDTAAFADDYSNQKAALRLRIRADHTVLERVRTRCHEYASRMESQINAQKGNTEFLSDVQATVNNYFASRSPDTFNKLLKASQLATSKSQEDHALLLTAVRRALSAVSDYFYPPVDDEVACNDGQRRKMGPEQYLNRLEEYCTQLLDKSTADTLVKAELHHLVLFARRLNDIASKGVHAAVRPEEARQGLVGLYMFLANIITRIEIKTPNHQVELVGGPLRGSTNAHS